jgi:hypothetical protein
MNICKNCIIIKMTKYEIGLNYGLPLITPYMDLALPKPMLFEMVYHILMQPTEVSNIMNESLNLIPAVPYFSGRNGSYMGEPK